MTQHCTDNACKIHISTQEASDITEQIARCIISKLQAFDHAITDHDFLEIDGISINNQPCAEVTKESRIKVVNELTEEAYEIDVDTIVKTPLKDLVLALETSILLRLSGVTRIVGYYSKVHNWNSSKISELADRRKGNYWEGKRVNTEKIALLGE